MKVTRVAIGLTFLLAAPAVAQAAPPGAPLNDDYLESLQLNTPGSKLERTNILRDMRDTSKASVQGDVFAPPRSGGPAEPTRCPGFPGNYGRTVWYDFYPDVSGFMGIRASGFDAAIAVVPFNRTSSVPSFSARRCINGSTSTNEELLVPRVIKGRAYTVQIGGVGDAGGNLEVLFDFQADADGDGVEDGRDKCDRLPSSSSDGCPARLRADVVIRAQPLPTGIRLVGLNVKATRGSRVSVRCAGCPPQAKKAKTVSFGRLRGQRLRAGTSLVIRVVKKNAIGAYVQYRIKRGNFQKIERCLNPGSSKPRRRCG